MTALDNFVAGRAQPPGGAEGYRLLPDGALCGRYRVRRLLARGGMSEVYEAVHVDLQKRVALKVLSPELRNTREAHERFAAEAINSAAFQHANAVEVTDFGRVHGLPYLVMNLLVGEDLATRLERRGRMQASELLDVILPVACAVAAGHDRGIIHRDLKPANVFLHHEDGRMVPKLLDFGVSRMLGASRITVNASVFGTPQYMAPEQARGESSIDPRADQYALGVILYEALTGRLPRDSPHPHVLLYSVAFGSFPPPSAYCELPPGLERVILRAMERDPRRRFASMRELAAALLPFASADAQASSAYALSAYAGRAGAPRASDASAQVLDVRGLLWLLGEQSTPVLFGFGSVLALLALGVWLANDWLAALYPGAVTFAAMF
jgi:serine/threonine-protein kinase